LFSAAAVEGQLDAEHWTWSVQGTVQGLETSSEALSALPAALAARFQWLSSYRGQTQLNFRAQGQGCDWRQSQFACSGTSRGRIEDRRLPQPLTDVQLQFRCDGHTFELEQATARAGETRLTLSGSASEYLTGGPWRCQGVAEHLMLDEQVAQSLPTNWREAWQQISPRGLVNARMDLAFDGQAWSHDLVVECLDVSATYQRFPYPLSKLCGRVHLRDGVIELTDLRASANGRPVQLRGQFCSPLTGGAGWFEFSLQDPIPLDEELLSAVQGPGQGIVRALTPHGFITAWGRYERLADDPTVLHKRLEIGLTDCSINYDKFPYPLYRIRGKLSMTDDRWSFTELEGCNDSGWVLCSGRWEPVPTGGTVLALDFHAMDVPLEDELRNALKPEMQRVWNSLCPRGTIDQLQIAVQFASQSQQLSVDVRALKRPPAQNVDGRSITVKPTWLPYQWDDVFGSAHYRNGVVYLQSVQATHNDTRLEFSGQIETPPQGPWRLRLSPLCVDRIDPTREFLMALPPRLGHAVSRLNVSGLVSLRGSVDVLGDGQGGALPSASWKLDVDLEDGVIDCGARFEHLHGGLVSEGQYNGNTLFSSGELRLDSLMYRGVQLTHVGGPVHMEDANLLFGERIPESRRHGPPRPVTAAVWGGTLAGSGTVELGEPSSFELDVSLTEGDLAVISQEATVHKRQISGRAFANVRLNGSSEGTHTLRGRGRALLREADLYELPVMVALLKLLTITTPDRTAFTSSDVDFRVEADRVYFDRIDFDGDAISLDGRGEMSFDRQLHLTFGTIVGRDDYYATLLRPILKEAGRRLMVIEVNGSVDSPQVTREFVPQLSERFQQLFPGASTREPPQTSRLPDPHLNR
jgi:hypothetical protein